MVTEDIVVRAFARMGVRAVVGTAPTVRLDVRRDAAGEVFVVEAPAEAEVLPLQVRPDERHLLLLARNGDVRSRFLCGHDERHWFVAAVPESDPVSTVAAAREALKPADVRVAQRAVRSKLRNRRRNPAYLRQGEWFFVPAPDLRVDPLRIRRHEPLRGNGGNTHLAEESTRSGGRVVWVCTQYPRGISDGARQQLVRRRPESKNWRWTQMMRDPELYIRGKVSHPEHATVVLHGWHRVHLNTEHRARARANVVFLD